MSSNSSVCDPKSSWRVGPSSASETGTNSAEKDDAGGPTSEKRRRNLPSFSSFVNLRFSTRSNTNGLENSGEMTRAIGADESMPFDEEDPMYKNNKRKSITEQEKNEPTKTTFMPCLNPEYTLRSQLCLTFGFVNFVIISFVVVICVAVVLFVGEDYKDLNNETFEELGNGLQGRTARYLAESLQYRLIPDGDVNLLYEMTRDRMMGYPISKSDDHVPFADQIETNKNQYPIVGPELPLDWQIKPEDNAQDLQTRSNWYVQDVSTKTAGFIFQGLCDPSQRNNPNSLSYFPNCTDQNNNLETGGMASREKMASAEGDWTSAIYERAGDLSPVLKAIYEYNRDIHELGVYFANQGAGATVSFPHMSLNGTHSYTSIGCDWASETVNPLKESSAILPREQTQDCPKAGTKISSRAYNPLLRDWCRRQALNPGKLLVEGPYLDAFTAGTWLLSFGRSVYDPITHEFVACTYVGVQINFVEEIMRGARPIPGSQISIARWDRDGTVVASSAFNISQEDHVSHIDDLNIGIPSQSVYESEFFELVDYDQEWNATDVQTKYEKCLYRGDGFVVAAHPIPPVPESYDETYKPEYLAFVSVDEEEFFRTVREVNESTDSHINRSIIFATTLGAGGFVFSMIILLLMSHTLTIPLQQMNKVAQSIVDSFGDNSSQIEAKHKEKKKAESAISQEEAIWDKDDGSIEFKIGHTGTTDSQEHQAVQYPSSFLYNDRLCFGVFTKCIPRTEIGDLVHEFNSMVASFSGSFVTRSARSTELEIMNKFSAPAEFLKLYRSRNEDQDGETSNIGDAGTKNARPSSLTGFNNIDTIEEHEEECNTFEKESDDGEEHEIVFENGESVDGHTNGDVYGVLGDGEEELPAAEGVVDTDHQDEETAVDKTEKDLEGEAEAEDATTQSGDLGTDSSVNDQDETGQYKPETEKDDKDPTEVTTNGNVDATPSQPRAILQNTAIHLGVNRVPEDNQKTSPVDDEQSDSVSTPKGIKSPMFIWIVLLIVVPVVLTAVIISTVVLLRISDELDNTVEDSEKSYLDVELRALGISSKLRANFVSENTARPLRDLYILTRYSSWLLFNGIQRSSLFRKAWSDVDQCKYEEESWRSCPWTIENRVCDCSWNWPDEECTMYPPGASRKLQQPYFFVSSDAAEANGDRNGTDYPNIHYSPNTTQWWKATNLPGSVEGEKSSGYDSSYDRARAGLAVPLFAALQNYDVDKEVGVGHYLTFEADGMLISLEGCGSAFHTWAAYWESTEANGGATFRPELCPIGRYGFEPRCREWYAVGKEKASKGHPVHVTSPYVFAGGTLVAQSATSPLTDPRTGQHIGQVLIDFEATSVFKKLTTANTYVRDGGFVLMITMDSDQFGGDTVIGPGISGTADGVAVSDVVIPHDLNCTTHVCLERKKAFSEIIQSMKSGEADTKRFVRSTASGGSEEMVITYAPTEVRFLEPVDSSDFSQGAVPMDEKIYSVALVEPIAAILEAFDEVEGDMNNQLNVAIAVLSIFIFFAVVIAIFVSYRVARSITGPILYLLEMIEKINHLQVDQEPPAINRNDGSKEVIYVSYTIHSLYRAIRLANAFFNAGELEVAYSLLVDALTLFKRLGNKKAIGVAYNNLGNTLFAMYREMKEERTFFKSGLTIDEVIKKGISCYNEAIRLGEKGYDDFYDREGWTPNCLDFMQHLSNRYFNRAMFLMHVKGDHQKTRDLEKLGIRDLEIARDMDSEVISYGEEIGWNSTDRAESVFSVGLARLRGHVLLVEMGFPDTWDIEEKIEELQTLLASESKKPNSDLFREVTYAGRMQELETEMIRYALLKKDIKRASQIAIRPIMEDEYIFHSTMIQSVLALMAYVESYEVMMDDSARAVLRQELKELWKTVMDDKMAAEDSQADSVVSSSTVSPSMQELFQKSVELASDRSSDGLRSSAMTIGPEAVFLSRQVVTMEQF